MRTVSAFTLRLLPATLAALLVIGGCPPPGEDDLIDWDNLLPIPGGKVPTRFNLKVDLDGAGTVDPAGGDYEDGTVVTLTATPSTGWRFGHWAGDVSGGEETANPLTVVMAADKTITAVFVPQFNFRAKAQGAGTIDIGDGNPSESLDVMLDSGSDLLVTAQPAEGWWFLRWEGYDNSAQPTIPVPVVTDVDLTAVFVAVTGHRTASTDGVLGRMTLLLNGNRVRGVRRSNGFAADLEGEISGDEIVMTSSSPYCSDATIEAILKPDGSLVGTIDGSGFNNDPWSADPVSFTGLPDPVGGVRTTELDGDSGLLAAVVQDGNIRGTWRLALTLGGDIEGTVQGDQVEFSVFVPGCSAAQVTATVRPDGSWVGTINGSGYHNDPFEAQSPFFP